MSENEDRNVTPIRPVQEPERSRPQRKLILLAVLMLLLILFVCLLLVFGWRNPGFLSGGSAAPEDVFYQIDEGRANVYAACRNTLAAVTDSGLTVYNADGEALGTAAHVYAAPLLRTGNRLVMACDVGGTRLTVMDGNGTTVLDWKSEGTLLDADLSAGDAVCCAELGRDDKTVLTVYDKKQNQIYRWYSGTRYFNQCAVSEDASWLCAAALSGGSGSFESRAVLFCTDQEDPAAEVSLGSQLIRELRFLNEDTVCAIGESCVLCFTTGGEILGTYDYPEDSLRDFAVSRDGLIVLLLRDSAAGGESTLVSLDQNAGMLAERGIGEEILSLSAAGSRCAVLTPSGLAVYDETLTLCASAETQDDASAAVLLDDGSAILIGGGAGRLWLPG